VALPIIRDSEIPTLTVTFAFETEVQHMYIILYNIFAID
jgi:hypothetical protein